MKRPRFALRRRPFEGRADKMTAEATGLKMSSLSDEIVGRIDELGAISETPAALARVFLTKEF